MNAADELACRVECGLASALFIFILRQSAETGIKDPGSSSASRCLSGMSRSLVIRQRGRSEATTVAPFGGMRESALDAMSIIARFSYRGGPDLMLLSTILASIR